MQHPEQPTQRGAHRSVGQSCHESVCTRRVYGFPELFSEPQSKLFWDALCRRLLLHGDNFTFLLCSVIPALQ